MLANGCRAPAAADHADIARRAINDLAKADFVVTMAASDYDHVGCARNPKGLQRINKVAGH